MSDHGPKHLQDRSWHHVDTRMGFSLDWLVKSRGDEDMAAPSEVAQGTVAAVSSADFVILHRSLEALRFVLRAAFH